MTLRAQLLARIAASGPITLADYMADCLLHPKYGYYATRDPLGTGGDFTTAPEISQMFGEMIGLCLAQSWLDQGAPTPFILAEIGPGRGTAMADMLRATRAVPGFHAALQVHLVEASPTLRDKQKQSLSAYKVTWHDAADTLPELPLYLLANEFFDALPIRQFQRDGTGWRELLIGAADNQLTFGLSDPTQLAALDHRLPDTRNGDIVELCAPASAIAQTIGQHIQSHGGTALVIDYGDWRSLGDTLQALSAHQHTDPLADPGNADLTTHVDFEALATATPSAHTRLTTQGIFLERLGITARANALAQRLTGTALETHIAAHRRLTDPTEMGRLFKVIAFYRRETPPPPGFDQ